MTKIGKTVLKSTAMVVGLIISGVGNASAMDASCAIANKELVCADGAKKSSAVFAALASPATMKNIKAAKASLFQTSAERERFRRSVERARQASKRHADRSLRQMKRRKISAADYEQVKTQFGQAMTNYNAALDLYSARDWYSPSRDKNAEGSE